ncbi:MAG TPA: C40 family peptidase [Rhodocyclaceae bacterium]|nr:C40 family peptidase [Rhodocyclaceae bacterium]
MRSILLLPLVIVLAACGGPAVRQPEQAETITQRPVRVSDKGNDVVLYALSLLDTGYRFGGKNPEAGLDCSGMVSYIFERAAGMRVSGSAADIARVGRAVEREQLQPGDLVFFNTLGRPFSHVGIYIGDDRFVHAPKTNAKVRIDRLSDRYFAQRFEAAKTYFD